MAKKKGKSFFTILLLIINLLFVLCLLVSYLAPYISPEKIWILAFFGLAYPIWLAVNLLFVLLWLLLWKRYIWISILAIALGFTFLLASFQFRSLVAPPAGSMKILSYNVHSLYGISPEKSGKRTRSEVSNLLIAEKPDFACIQEFYVRSDDSTEIIGKFAASVYLPEYAYKNYYTIKDKKRVNAIVTVSKYPVVRTGSLRLNNLNVFAIFSDHLVGKDTIRVYNLHLKSINLGDDDYSFYAHLTETEKKAPEGLKDGSIKIIAKLRRAFALRAQQVDILVAHIHDSPYPVIICGDFNDSPTSYTYHEMTAGLNDSFRKAGKGIFGNTYAGKFPSFRIDYILYGSPFKAFSYKRYNTDLSDHYPISVYLKY